MQLAISSELFTTFWTQLFQNIGYSRVYKRFVILEPVCYLIGYNNSIHNCVPIDPLVYPWDIGTEVANVLDEERSAHIEQILVPYIMNNKYSYILLSDEPLIFQRQQLPTFILYLQKNPYILKCMKGLIHYHIDEPCHSKADIQTMLQFTSELISLGGNNQIGLIISEQNPNDTLEVKKHGMEPFITHLSTKLKKDKIDIEGLLYTGYRNEISSIDIKIEL